jgi:acyl-CoA synthetase (AMP-forming)/AMP-acid ligase II
LGGLCKEGEVGPQEHPPRTASYATTRLPADTRDIGRKREQLPRCPAAGFKAPTTVGFRDGHPRTATGKVQKFRLREPYWAGHQRGVN